VLSGTTNKNYVFVIGRQHPPEITGSIGLMSFIDTVAGDSPLARKFRSRFQVVVVPVVNPDGVEHGHWRSNLGGVDLNRDWRVFSQPETAALRDFILRYAQAPGARAELFVDFHSTGTNIFYSVPQEQDDAHQNFTDHWLAALRNDCPEFSFERDDTHNATEATSKAWAHAALHVPSITDEFGYSTDRNLVRQAARFEAEDMMKLLLADEDKTARGE
jgi:predicted deacylase